MINGAHVVIYSKNPEADRKFFRDVLQFPSVDAGHGWLIFAMPKAEAAFHDAESNDKHELFLMCDDLAATLKELKAKKVKVSDVSEQRWGKLAALTLPSGGKVGIYEPKHRGLEEEKLLTAEDAENCKEIAENSLIPFFRGDRASTT